MNPQGSRSLIHDKGLLGSQILMNFWKTSKRPLSHPPSPPCFEKQCYAFFWKVHTKMCKEIFWIGNDPPPLHHLEDFQKFIQIWEPMRP